MRAVGQLLALGLLCLCTSVHAQTPYNCAMTNRDSRSDTLALNFLIDPSVKKAYMMANNGASEVIVIPNDDAAVSFIEVTKSGNVMTTTITDKGRAVHSRNSVMRGDLNPSQYLGTCSRK